MRNLHVWSDSTHIGVFSQRSGGSLVRFEYDDAKGAPISLSLPRTGAYSDIAPKAFLENLLPESRKARWRMADRLGVDSVDTFDLLAGVDVTGGLVFTPSAEEPSVQGEARPLDDDELAAQIIQTRAAGSAWFARTEHCRFSLAGGQPKFTLANHNGTWLWPNIAIPSTHIIKPADAALAVRLGERLRELKPYSGVLDRMFTGFSDRLPNGERADTGWAPPTSTAVMDDGLRERMRRAIGARTWQEFLDAVYKLGLFRED